MPDDRESAPEPSPFERWLGARRPIGPAVVAIALSVGVAAAAFAYTGGWLSPGRLTAARIVDVLGKRGGDPVGHRRNHAKGICFTGTFESGGEGSRLSTAPMLKPGRYPVIGRLAIAVADPLAADATGRVRSMAVRIVAPDGQEWRSGMNNMPVFLVATPQAFYEQSKTQDIDPATGKPDPKAAERFFAAHPESAPFLAWAKTAPWTSTYADQIYWSLNAFRFIDGQGHARAVRWAMMPDTPMQVVSPAELARRGSDALEVDLKQRLASGALGWTLVASLAAPGDPTNDSTKAWPEDRPKVTLGRLIVDKAQDEADGPCRDYNYDPLILPKGIAPSDDPLLSARSAAYAVSFDRRTAEAARYPRKAAQ